MTHEVLPHKQVRFTRADGSVWLFRLVGIREAGMVMPLPTPKVVTTTAEGEEQEIPVAASLPPALRRAKIMENVEATAALLQVTSVSPKIVPDSEPIAEGADAAYLHELGMDAHEMANTILKLSGFGGDDLDPFPGNGESGTDRPGSAEVRDAATPSPEA